MLHVINYNLTTILRMFDPEVCIACVLHILGTGLAHFSQTQNNFFQRLVWSTIDFFY